MKKHLSITTLIACISCLPVASQSLIDFHAGIFYLKVKPYIYTSHYFELDSEPTFRSGICYKERSQRFNNFSFSIDYIKNNYTLSSGSQSLAGGYFCELDNTLSSIAFMPAYNLSFGNKFRIFWSVGLYYEYVISANGTLKTKGWYRGSDYMNDGYYNEVVINGDLKSQINRSNFNAFTGIGLEIEIAPKIAVSTELQISPYINDRYDAVSTSNNGMQYYLQAGIGYRIQNFSVFK